MEQLSDSERDINATAIIRTAHRRPEIEEYVKSLHARPKHAGRVAQGEIELVSDFEAVLTHQEELYKRALTTAMSKGAEAPNKVDLRPQDLGICYNDPFYYIARDPVLFPNAKDLAHPIKGSYLYICFAGSLHGQRSSHVMLMTEEGKFVLTKIFRYQQARWVLESTGTVTQPNETQASALDRLMKQKQGRELLTSPKLIGAFSADRGCIADTVDHFALQVGPQLHEPTDPIYKMTVELTMTGLLTALARGSWKDPQDGRTYFVNDDYLSASLLYGVLRGVFPQEAFVRSIAAARLP